LEGLCICNWLKRSKFEDADKPGAKHYKAQLQTAMQTARHKSKNENPKQEAKNKQIQKNKMGKLDAYSRKSSNG